MSKITKLGNGCIFREGKLFSYEEDELYGRMSPKKILLSDPQKNSSGASAQVQQPKKAK